MGCDIHIYVEKKVKGKWLAADKWKNEEAYYTMEGREIFEGRNYSLFGVLAGVRRDDVPLISKPRGFPKDASKEVEGCYTQWEGDGHSTTWLSLEDIQNFDWTQRVKSEGWVTFDTYEKWERWGKQNDDEPEMSCGSVGGGATQHVTVADFALVYGKLQQEKSLGYWASLHKTIAEMNHQYALIQWERPLYRMCAEFLSEVIPKLWRIKQSKGVEDVRLVFWFDN